MEGVEWYYDSGILKMKDAEQMREELRTAKSSKLQETLN